MRGGGVAGRCLKRILNILWEQKLTTAEIAQKTGIKNINDTEKETPLCYIKMKPFRPDVGRGGGGRKPRQTWIKTIERNGTSR